MKWAVGHPKILIDGTPRVAQLAEDHLIESFLNSSKQKGKKERILINGFQTLYYNETKINKKKKKKKKKKKNMTRIAYHLYPKRGCLADLM
jgi:hypothetical protein